MSKYRKLTHVYYKCDYHIVFTPKYRFQILEGMVKSLIEYDIQLISNCKGVQIQEMNIQKDHIYLVCSIPPKVFISEFMGILKGKLAIKLFKTYPTLKQKPYWGNHFWSRGYFVSTVGLDEDMIKRYVKYQEHNDNQS
ncbi:IS200/IS605 family transposase [Myroides pelagicus]|uniref:IS200/IS605 family transposase n=1 Tax=Myroides pelagicus TaxID=270914 RepID=A0A7K1GP53_9FLAO|nr:IS200/IS605 family transposase [Myroides pelagicus]MEC4114560.1 IS200/IS605 family transposase [Myroides pelagicus]MTH30183.1 IS200/IS605 family transposase [Myroides pelagicus]